MFMAPLYPLDNIPEHNQAELQSQGTILIFNISFNSFIKLHCSPSSINMSIVILR